MNKEFWDTCLNSLQTKPSKVYKDLTGNVIESGQYHKRTSSLGGILRGQGIGFLHVTGGGVRMQHKK